MQEKVFGLDKDMYIVYDDGDVEKIIKELG
jgi:hypothetical protein